MINRKRLLAKIQAALRRSRVVALIGPRQSGKTTVARQIVAGDSPNYFDLEDPASLARLTEPMTALAPLRGVVVIDEVQRQPDLFTVLRVLADRRPLQARFLILGSASPDLLRQSSESLAGRLETIVLTGFTLEELGARALTRHWCRGGFPRALLARSDADSFRWRQQFIQTYLERDLPQLGVNVSGTTMLRFWTMLAHYHGNIWNAAELARSLGVSEPTVRRYLDLMTDLFVVRQLPPWHENLKKRQVRSPKVYLRDSGLAHQLLGIRTQRDLLTHPKLGASWEGYAIEEAIKLIEPGEAYFWATHTGAELDLLIFKDGRRYGIEVKRQDAPRITPSMRTALTDLRLQSLTILYPGTRRYRLGERITVVPASELAEGSPDVVLPRVLRRKRRTAA
ncbi:MAG TPA: ATP-binding protein [Candidatus Methylomirabilis sp.]|nr:ATP-binding protein [Candidatus Methylomirabilis sp.]